MKIGILTFHSQLNYGGVLQAYALQTYLCEMGHEAVLLDHWMDDENSSLVVRANVIRKLFNYGVRQRVLRSKATILFGKRYLCVTPFHFTSWADVDRAKLDVDLIIVGSDQVFNPDYIDSLRFHLLEGAPVDLPAITYAASLGVDKLSVESKSMFEKNLSRFLSISLRECCGVELFHGLGFNAVKTMDPVFLLSSSQWDEHLNIKKEPTTNLVCYLMSEDLMTCVTKLGKWAIDTGRHVEVFLDNFQLPAIYKPDALLSLIELVVLKWKGLVDLKLTAGPREFLASISNAKDVVTDSFHAMAFSFIFGKNVKVIKSHDPNRGKMYTRIFEFSKYTGGLHVSNSFDEALKSFDGNHHSLYGLGGLKREVDASKRWLQDTIAELK